MSRNGTVIAVPTAKGSTHCHIGRDFAANRTVVSRFQFTMRRCYPNLAMTGGTTMRTTIWARLGGGAVALLLAAGGAVAAAGQASAATPLCSKMVQYTNASGHQMLVPATSGGSRTCLIGRGLVANESIVVGLQRTMIGCYGGLRLAPPYATEFIRDLDSDGSFGPRTEAAMKAVQANIGSGADGVYGPMTRDRMEFLHRCYRYR